MVPAVDTPDDMRFVGSVSLRAVGIHMFWLAIHLISTAMMVTGALGVFGAGDAPAWMVTVDGVVAGVIGSAGIALGVAAVYGLRYTTGRPDADSGLARG